MRIPHIQPTSASHSITLAFRNLEQARRHLSDHDVAFTATSDGIETDPAVFPGIRRKFEQHTH